MSQTIASILHSHFTHPSGISHSKPSSRTVATWRAAHQLLDNPKVFNDPLALAILGVDQEYITNQLELHQHPLSAAMRIAIAVRSRFAEDEREKALASGTQQYVILGAGLDSYGLRSQHSNEQVFEVDLAATQQHKLSRVSQLGVHPLCELNYVSCDFEQGSLESSLIAAGFNKQQKAFFSWLGVVPYLDMDAIDATLDFIAGCAPGSAMVFDYIVDTGSLNEIEAMVVGIFAQQLAAGGEPIKTYFSPQNLLHKLASYKFSTIENISPDYLNQRYLANRGDGLRVGNVTRMAKITV